MAYTNTWDETAPADTSLANLIGQDIRNFKLDVRQRIASFTAGNQASAPYPETVWNGVLYFATDTHKVLQYNGTAWVDITAGFPGGPQGPPGPQGPQGPAGAQGATGPAGGQIVTSFTMSSGTAGNGASPQSITSVSFPEVLGGHGLEVWCGLTFTGTSSNFNGFGYTINGVSLFQSGPLASSLVTPYYIVSNFIMYDLDGGTHVIVIGGPTTGSDSSSGAIPRFFGEGTPSGKTAANIVTGGTNTLGLVVFGMPSSMSVQVAIAGLSI